MGDAGSVKRGAERLWSLCVSEDLFCLLFSESVVQKANDVLHGYSSVTQEPDSASRRRATKSREILSRRRNNSPLGVGAENSLQRAWSFVSRCDT